MQQAQAFCQRGQVQAVQHVCRQDFVQIGCGKGSLNGAAQGGLVQAVYGGIHGGEAVCQRVFVCCFELGMNHLQAVKTVFDFAQGAHLLSFGELFLVAGIKVDEAQVEQAAGLVPYPREQLFSGREPDFLQQHFALYLTGHADWGIGNRGDAGFVFITQRQVQCQIPQAVQAEFFQFFGGVVGEFELFFQFGRHGYAAEWNAAAL